ncbi:beta-1,4-glucuronyltransferase 1-like isoform X2 [Eriocheir sinensis]|uniref:beta-1,4-glucuronyltransferase 1-like isoform X2 n=1 Tax=Eriocheir sinensis TaxID=95602 RepID=UPI0021C79ED4|nr:beta-1,4-glucuronyltransferase 1-like isoform X2 [Eriocheir sinensis]XP_050694303.1 beta-1,4-glucuronyltransferase 1-like isoform X2 [Eriocheir sinensis]XP_050694304.1 beta-1,4-glucuronyltransferase 1-like isoform X2 [Eriocheir sinensis]XP_050694305.1 beta-1,4-glucuronyltransferase 1-like isoform X2 [Eriocheir sinensis]
MLVMVVVMKQTAECVDRNLHKVCGKQCFVVVNVVVVAVNLCLGLVVNLTAFSTRGNTSPPFTSNLLHRDNLTLMEVEGVVPAALGLSDASGNFTSHAFVWAAREWVNVTGGADVCLATHSSADQLHWVAQHTLRWSGPLSVAVFVSGREYAVAASMVEYLRRCVDGVEQRVSFHLVHPLSRPPKPSTASPPFVSCGAPQEANKQLVAALGQDETPHPRYPQNLMRNLARRACHTPYSLNVDIDMLTSPHMSPRLSRFLHGRPVCGRCAYVVPVYEVHSAVTSPPADKMDLLRLLLRGRVRRFHEKVYEKNQGNTHLENWEVERPGYLPPPVAYEVLYNISSYEEFWEPVLVLPRGAPAFDERFVGYGFTRSSQVYELHVRGFRFFVLDEAFLTHSGFQTTATYAPSRYAQIEINRIRYQMFKKELHARLGLPPPPPLSPPAPRRTSRGLRLSISGRRPRYVLRGLPDLLVNKGI